LGFVRRHDARPLYRRFRFGLGPSIAFLARLLGMVTMRVGNASRAFFLGRRLGSPYEHLMIPVK
jgi:hypothetical protein